MGAFSALGNATKKGVYHLTTGGVDHLMHSVGLRDDMFKAAHELSAGGTVVRALLGPPLAVVNVASHATALGVRGTKALGKGYIGLWKNRPVAMALGTAAMAVPVAYSMMSADKKRTSSGHESELRDLDETQAQTGQMLELLQASEPAAQRPEFSTLQQARPQIASASAAPQGVVAMGPAVNQGMGA